MPKQSAGSPSSAALIKKLISDWKVQQRVVYIDCREGDFTTPASFADAVLKRIPPTWQGALAVSIFLSTVSLCVVQAIAAS